VLIKTPNEISSFTYLVFRPIVFVVKRADIITNIDLETLTTWIYYMDL
jgi:hypothetical protein